MNNIANINHLACTGCGACAQICPMQCITLQPDKFGFTYPAVAAKCINCGKCLTICPITVNGNLVRYYPQFSYLAQSSNRRIEEHSASGGVCASLADYWVSSIHGTVFGSVMMSNFQVQHVAINRVDHIIKMQGSKYIQSNTQDSFAEVKRLLLAGQPVLYIGTPCQIAGLRCYLSDDYNNLLTVDLVCHGVPSQMSFDKYIRYLSSRYGADVISYTFRNKTFYDRVGFRSNVLLSNGKSVMKKSDEDIFFALFAKGKTYRESCYRCQYANPYRVGDITCGDCASRNIYKNFLPYEAVSSLLINSHKGEKIWTAICGSFRYAQLDLVTEIRLNKQLHECTARPDDRDEVCQLMMEEKWEDLCKSYIEPHRRGFWKTFREYIPIALKKKVQRCLDFYRSIF